MGSCGGSQLRSTLSRITILGVDELVPGFAAQSPQEPKHWCVTDFCYCCNYYYATSVATAPLQAGLDVDRVETEVFKAISNDIYT